MNWKNLTLQSIWKMSKEKLIFIFCSGLLLFILSIPSDGDGLFGRKESVDSKSVSTSENGLAADEGGVQAVDSTYEAELEERV